MTWATSLIFLFVAVLICIYFLPYKKLKGKIFKKVFPDTSLVDSVSFRDKDFSVSFKRLDQVWKMVFPICWPADTEKMRGLLLKLSELNADGRISGKNPSDSLYSIGRGGVLELEAGGKTITFQFGGSDETGGAYMTMSGDSDILLINASFLSVLPKNEDDFKRTLLFEESYADVRYTGVFTKGKSSFMTRTDDGWIMNEKNVFDENARPFIEGVLNIKAEGFADGKTKLPPKHEGVITVKALGKEVSRYFFTLPEYKDKYLVPAEGEILVVSKTAVEEFFGL